MDEQARTQLEGAIAAALAGIEVDSYQAEQQLAKLAVGSHNYPALAQEYLAEQVAPLPDDADAAETAIAAYIIAHTWNRRQGNKIECDRLDERMTKLEGRRNRFPVLHHFMAMTKVMGNQAEVREAVGMAARAAREFPAHPGIQHSLASAYLRRSEFDELTDDELRIAEHAVSDAIVGESGKARFHYSRARIYKLQKKFDQALDSLATAVSLEDSSSSDYQLRIAEYKIETAAVVIEKRLDGKVAHTEEQVTHLNAELSTAKTALEGAQLRQVETLAIFTAMLGLLSFSAGIIGEFKLWEACVLVAVVGVVLIGAVVAAHAMIDARFRKRDRA